MRTVPQHIVVIPDGNRRWAKSNNILFENAYSMSADSINKIIEFAVSNGVEYVTVWPVSTKTWMRSLEEIEVVLNVLSAYVVEAQGTFPERGWRFRTIGRLDRLERIDAELSRALRDLCARTEACDRANIILAIDYDGQEEIVRAVNRILNENTASIGRHDFRRYLDTGDVPDPDLLLRFGGDRRLSNFILYQIGYAELFFLDDDLPDFQMERLNDIFTEFAERRYSQ